MALLNHIAAAPASLPPTEMDRIEALRAALERIALTDTGRYEIDVAQARVYARHALRADDRAAAAQDNAQIAERNSCEPDCEHRVYGWQPSGLIRELGDRPTDPMEPLR